VIEEDGDWVVTGWDRYYPTDRTNADRQRRWRNRQREDEHNDSNVTHNTRNAVTTSRATVDVDVDEVKEMASDEAAAFDAIWGRYPDRLGGNPKRRALNALRARIREGVETAGIIEGLDRYIKYLKANDRIGTEYVMQAATFLGPDRRWTEEWSTAKPQNGKDEWADFRAAYTYDPDA
jgi:hypothetical protein